MQLRGSPATRPSSSCARFASARSALDCSRVSAGCAHAASPAPQATSIETSSFMTQTPHRGGTGRRRVLRLRRGRGTQLLNGEHALPRPLNDRLGGPTFAAATGNERWRDPVGTIRRVRGGEEESESYAGCGTTSGGCRKV